MLDSKLLRTDPDFVTAALKRRGFDFPIRDYEALEARRKQAQVDSEQLQSQRKKLSRKLAKPKRRGKTPMN